MIKNVLIIGGGEIGSALAYILRQNTENKIAVWDIDPTKCSHDTDLHNVAHDANIIFLCVPSWSIRSAIECVKEHVQKDDYVIALTKGIEPESKKFIPDFCWSTLTRVTLGYLPVR